MKKVLALLLLALSPLSAEYEETLAIIKPNAFKKHHVGEIISAYEKAGLDLIALEKTELSQDEAAKFYAEHKDRPFFKDLTEFMSSGPVVVLVLGGENAVSKNRDLMGATDPKKAAPGTIRALYGDSLGENAVHGSDSTKSASREIAFFFPGRAL